MRATVGASAILASASAQAEPVFDQVVVTAEKRSENLQELPQSISVLNSETLDQQNVRSLIDLSALAPGVTVTNNSDYRLSVSIRGLGNEGNQNNIVNPSVSNHIDGVYVASLFALKADFLDVDQVEILRGPQGTLFGQNSIGGAINVTTKEPQFDRLSGIADIAYGSFDQINARGSVNVPLTDRLAVRGAVSFYEQDGTAINRTTGSNATNFDQFTNVVGFEQYAFLGDIDPVGQEADGKNNLSWRVRTLWRPSEFFELDLTAQQFDEDSNGAAAFGLDDATPLRDENNRRQFSQDSPGYYRLDSDFYSAIAKVNLPFATLKAIGSYQRNDITQAFDNDRTDNAFVSSFVLANTSVVDAYVGELNLVSTEPLFGKLDWVVGAFYFDENVDFTFFELLDLVGVNGDPSSFPDGEFDPFDTSDPTFFLGFAPAGTDLGFQTQSFLERESFSFYGQGTWSFSDTVSLTGGLRYTDDATNSETFNFFTLPNGVAPAVISQSDTAFSGRAALEVLIPSGQLVYASYTRGFKPGGSNITFGLDGDAAAPVVPQTFGAESVNAYEVGLKGDYIERKGYAQTSLRFSTTIQTCNFKRQIRTSSRAVLIAFPPVKFMV